ncbi:MAG: hypothetical protein ACRDV9_12460 [Acidimicrobiia bacterium]
MPTTPERQLRRAEQLLREVVCHVNPNAFPETLRWDIVDFLGDQHEKRAVPR